MCIYLYKQITNSSKNKRFLTHIVEIINMKISEALSVLNTQLIFERTPKGRAITEYAANTLKAILEDKKNWDFSVVKCKNCGIILSSLLVESGCKNCGSKDLELNVTIIS
jgi:Zn finger protein HypA/HybF involved in hydrogenase expression